MRAPSISLARLALALLLTSTSGCDAKDGSTKSEAGKDKAGKGKATKDAPEKSAPEKSAPDKVPADDAAAPPKGAEAKPADAEDSAPAKALGKPVITDGELDLGAEKVGDLHIGMTAADLEAKLGKAASQSPIIMEEATGEHVQDWTYPAQGLEIGLWSADEKGTDQKVRSITAGDKCTLALPWGLAIGSPRADVEKVYGTHFDKDMSDAQTFIAGSVYGGSFYGFKDGKVASLFIGAGAE